MLNSIVYVYDSYFGEGKAIWGTIGYEISFKTLHWSTQDHTHNFCREICMGGNLKLLIEMIINRIMTHALISSRESQLNMCKLQKQTQLFFYSSFTKDGNIMLSPNLEMVLTFSPVKTLIFQKRQLSWILITYKFSLFLVREVLFTAKILFMFANKTYVSKYEVHYLPILWGKVGKKHSRWTGPITIIRNGSQWLFSRHQAFPVCYVASDKQT